MTPHLAPTPWSSEAEIRTRQLHAAIWLATGARRSRFRLPHRGAAEMRRVSDRPGAAPSIRRASASGPSPRAWRRGSTRATPAARASTRARCCWPRRLAAGGATPAPNLRYRPPAFRPWAWPGCTATWLVNSVADDGRGGVKGAFYIRILGYVQAFSGRDEFTGSGSWSRGQTPRSPAGNWRRSGIHDSDVKPVFLFACMPRYLARLPLRQLAGQVLRELFPAHFALPSRRPWPLRDDCSSRVHVLTLELSSTYFAEVKLRLADQDRSVLDLTFGAEIKRLPIADRRPRCADRARSHAGHA